MHLVYGTKKPLIPRLRFWCIILEFCIKHYLVTLFPQPMPGGEHRIEKGRISVPVAPVRAARGRTTCAARCCEGRSAYAGLALLFRDFSHLDRTGGLRQEGNQEAL